MNIMDFLRGAGSNEPGNPWVIFCIDTNAFFVAYDPYADPPGVMPYRTGRAFFTRDIQNAKTFDEIAKASAWYCQVHPSDPIRDDGAPNKPLTSYTIHIRRKHGSE